MRASMLVLLSLLIVAVSCESTSPPDTFNSSSTDSVTTVTNAINSSSTSSESSGSTGSSVASEVTNKVDSTTRLSLNLDNKEKLVTYTTKQKTVFIACCVGTCVLLIALAVLSGMSDTVARSRQKATKTHA